MKFFLVSTKQRLYMSRLYLMSLFFFNSCASIGMVSESI